MKFIKKYNENIGRSFDKISDKIDLRKIGKYVYCKKTLNNQENTFFKGKYYIVEGLMGDPERAIEEFNINYLPIECISTITIIDQNGKKCLFKVNPILNKHKLLLNFFNYFEVKDFVNNMDKYNL